MERRIRNDSNEFDASCSAPRDERVANAIRVE